MLKTTNIAFAFCACVVLLMSSPAYAVFLLVADEKATSGTSISLLNTSNGQVSAYLSGLANADGLALAPDGFLYATSFNGGTLNRVASPSSVTQIASGFNGSGALAVDASGAFYVPNFGVPSGGGTTLAKVTPIGAGNYSTLINFATGLSTPDGLAFDSHGTLFEADFGSNRINKIDTTTGAVTNFITNTAGLNQPSALVIDASDNLYVTNFGNGTVSKITSGGTVTNNYANGLNSPLGLLLDPSTNTFYASSWNGNTVSSFPLAGGTASVIASGFVGPTHLILQPVPEPSSLALIILGVASLSLCRRRRGMAIRPAA